MSLIVFMNQTIKLDKEGRIIEKIETASGLLYRYKYAGNKRIVKITITNKPKNKTIITEILKENSYLTIEKQDFSEKYILHIFYDENGRELKLIRKNRKNRKKYIKENILFKNNEPTMWIESYSGKKEFGFKIDF